MEKSRKETEDLRFFWLGRRRSPAVEKGPGRNRGIRPFAGIGKIAGIPGISGFSGISGIGQEDLSGKYGGASRITRGAPYDMVL